MAQRPPFMRANDRAGGRRRDRVAIRHLDAVTEANLPAETPAALDQNGVVAEADDGFSYPAVTEVVRLEIQPVE